MKYKVIEAAKTRRKKQKQRLNQIKNAREHKPQHGRYAERIRNINIDIIKTNRWLKSSGLKAGTKGLIIVAQD